MSSAYPSPSRSTSDAKTGPTPVSTTRPDSNSTLGYAHRPAKQAPLAQSASTAQAPASSQRRHADAPPQSMPVSRPLATPSSQRGAAQARLTHTPLAQSAFSAHASPVAQRAQEPPQSRAVS